MLKSVPMAKRSEPSEARKYVRLIELAEELHLSKDKLYGYVYRHRQQIETFHLPDSGKLLYVKTADADMLRAIFKNPEDFAEKVTRKFK